MNELYSNNDWRGYSLSHHGILGQKWGKKNGPPYPLKASQHSSSEKKAGWKKSIGGGRNESLYGRKTEIHSDYAKAHQKKNVKTMSDQELREALNRLNMEQQYARMNPTVVNNGRNVATKFLKDSATIVGVIAVGKKAAPYIAKSGKAIYRALM